MSNFPNGPTSSEVTNKRPPGLVLSTRDISSMPLAELQEWQDHLELAVKHRREHERKDRESELLRDRDRVKSKLKEVMEELDQYDTELERLRQDRVYDELTAEAIPLVLQLSSLPSPTDSTTTSPHCQQVPVRASTSIDGVGESSWATLRQPRRQTKVPENRYTPTPTRSRARAKTTSSSGTKPLPLSPQQARAKKSSTMEKSPATPVRPKKQIQRKSPVTKSPVTPARRKKQVEKKSPDSQFSFSSLVDRTHEQEASVADCFLLTPVHPPQQQLRLPTTIVSVDITALATTSPASLKTPRGSPVRTAFTSPAWPRTIPKRIPTPDELPPLPLDTVSAFAAEDTPCWDHFGLDEKAPCFSLKTCSDGHSHDPLILGHFKEVMRQRYGTEGVATAEKHIHKNTTALFEQFTRRGKLIQPCSFFVLGHSAGRCPRPCPHGHSVKLVIYYIRQYEKRTQLKICERPSSPIL